MRAFSELWTGLVNDESGSVGFIAQLFKQNGGATAIEYGLIAALIAVAAVTVMGTVGTNLSATFNSVAGSL
jgi:pilus assembly protein Flp/PilA